MSKKIISILLIIITAAAVWWVLRKSFVQVLGENIELVSFTSQGRPTGKMALKVPYLKNRLGLSFISAALDSDSDGSFSSSEWVIKNMPARAVEDWNSNFYFAANITTDTKTKVLLSGSQLPDEALNTSPKGVDQQELSVKVQIQEVGALLDLATVTNPEESMKGIPSAFAQVPEAGVYRSDTPDLTQRPGECAPTAAADSLISLAGEHGAIDKIPRNPSELVDQLKGDMNWTPADGVLPDNFVAGKNLWAAEHGLPVRTQKVGDKDGASTVEEIQQALENGGSAELRLRFTQSGQTRVIGGHMVSVVGVRTVDGHQFVDVHDPASPAGTDTYEVIGNQLINYGLHDGDTYISWGFTQVWEGTPTGQQLEGLSEEELRGLREFVGEKKKIKVIIVQGKKVPLEQVHVGKGPECDSEASQFPHYHANAGSVTALDGTVIADPGGCGYGKVQNIPVEDVEVP